MQPRPSIVALPVYPSPSGTLGRSWKLKLKRVALGLSWVTVVASNAAMWFYLGLRLQAMLEVDRKIPGVFVGGWTFLVLEAVVAVIMSEFELFLPLEGPALTTMTNQTAATSLWTTFTYRPSGSDPKMRLRGDANLPAVDVFIVSSGQSDQIVCFALSHSREKFLR